VLIIIIICNCSSLIKILTFLFAYCWLLDLTVKRVDDEENNFFLKKIIPLNKKTKNQEKEFMKKNAQIV